MPRVDLSLVICRPSLLPKIAHRQLRDCGSPVDGGYEVGTCVLKEKQSVSMGCTSIRLYLFYATVQVAVRHQAEGGWFCGLLQG